MRTRERTCRVEADTSFSGIEAGADVLFHYEDEKVFVYIITDPGSYVTVEMESAEFDRMVRVLSVRSGAQNATVGDAEGVGE